MHCIISAVVDTGMKRQQKKGKWGDWMSADGDKNSPPLLFFTATLELFVLQRLLGVCSEISTLVIMTD